MAASAWAQRPMSLTPDSEFVVAPAGYHFIACTEPLSLAAAISDGGVLSVRYSVINGSNPMPAGTADRIRSR